MDGFRYCCDYINRWGVSTGLPQKVWTKSLTTGIFGAAKSGGRILLNYTTSKILNMLEREVTEILKSDMDSSKSKTISIVNEEVKLLLKQLEQDVKIIEYKSAEEYIDG